MRVVKILLKFMSVRIFINIYTDEIIILLIVFYLFYVNLTFDIIYVVMFT